MPEFTLDEPEVEPEDGVEEKPEGLFLQAFYNDKAAANFAKGEGFNPKLNNRVCLVRFDNIINFGRQTDELTFIFRQRGDRVYLPLTLDETATMIEDKGFEIVRFEDQLKYKAPKPEN